MGSIADDRDTPGYESPESRQLREIQGQVLALADEVDRLKRYVERRSAEQQAAYQRMMTVLSDCTKEATS